LVVEVVSTTGVGLLAGLVTYALRGGALAASFLSTMPLWRIYDPLPILASERRKSKDTKENDITSQEDDDLNAERMFNTTNIETGWEGS